MKEHEFANELYSLIEAAFEELGREIVLRELDHVREIAEDENF